MTRRTALFVMFFTELFVIFAIPGSIALGIYLIHLEKNFCDNHLIAHIIAVAIMAESISFSKLSVEGFKRLKRIYLDKNLT